MSSVNTYTFTALEAAGDTDYQFVGGIGAKSGAFRVTLPATPSSVVVSVEYSDDGDGAADRKQVPVTLPDTAGEYVIPISTAHDYVRLSWDSGTIGAEEEVAVELDLNIQG